MLEGSSTSRGYDAGMAKWLSDDEQAVWRDYLVVSHGVEADLDRQLLSDVGMPHTQYGILVALSESATGELRMGEIADQLTFSPSRLAHAARAMEAKGLIERRQCDEDRRGQFASITAAGRDAIQAAAPLHVAAVRRLIFDGLDAADLAAFGRVLRDIRERLVGCPAE